MKKKIGFWFFSISFFLACLSSYAGERTQLKVLFLPVKSGNAVLLQTSSGFNVLIDSGDGAVPIVPILRANKIRRIDLAFITCPDKRNLGGFFELIRAGFDIGEFLSPDLTQTTADYDSLLEELMMKQDEMAGGGGNKEATIADALNNTKHFEFQNIQPGASFMLSPEISAVVLGPYTKYRNTKSDMGNNSLIVKVVYGNQGFLFTGNMGLESQRDMTKLATKIQSVVLQVPDNASGFATSSVFYQKVAPKFAVYQAATGTVPAALILTTLKGLGAEIYNTTEKSSVIFTTDGMALNAQVEQLQ
jgi:competence protein ComEC